MNDHIRYLFETEVYPHFITGYALRRKSNGEYVSETLEDHWQTFQEGYELAIRNCIEKLQDLRGYSGVGTDGNPYDTPSWNAALQSAQEIIQ
jgi:hypothetical protein